MRHTLLTAAAAVLVLAYRPAAADIAAPPPAPSASPLPTVGAQAAETPKRPGAFEKAGHEKVRLRSEPSSLLAQAEAAFLDGDRDKAMLIGENSAAFMLLLQAEEAFIGGDLDAAKRYIDTAIASGARAAAFVLRGIIYERLAADLHERADASIREALKLRPGDPKIERLLGKEAGTTCEPGR